MVGRLHSFWEGLFQGWSVSSRECIHHFDVTEGSEDFLWSKPHQLVECGTSPVPLKIVAHKPVSLSWAFFLAKKRHCRCCSTNMSPQKRDYFNNSRKYTFQPLIFRVYVSFREGRCVLFFQSRLVEPKFAHVDSCHTVSSTFEGTNSNHLNNPLEKENHRLKNAGWEKDMWLFPGTIQTYHHPVTVPIYKAFQWEL